MAWGSLNFLRVQLQQNTTGFGFQLGLHHNAYLVCLHLSCVFRASLFSFSLFAAVVSREQIKLLLIVLLSNSCVLKCSEVQYFKQNILK